jgi:hypothetical protein
MCFLFRSLHILTSLYSGHVRLRGVNKVGAGTGAELMVLFDQLELIDNSLTIEGDIFFQRLQY